MYPDPHESGHLPISSMGIRSNLGLPCFENEIFYLGGVTLDLDLFFFFIPALDFFGNPTIVLKEKPNLKKVGEIL